MSDMTMKKAHGSRPRFASDVMVGGSGMDFDAIRHMAKAQPDKFLQRVNDLIDAGTFSWHDVRDLQGFYRALKDVEVQVSVRDPDGERRTITTSALPVLGGQLSIAQVNRAFDEHPMVSDMLVEELETNQSTTHLLQLLSSDAPDAKTRRNSETDGYPEMTASETRYQVDTEEDGRRISIGGKTVETNNIADIIQRLNALGRWGRNKLERHSLRMVCDVYGSGTSATRPYVYRPDGVGAALYTTSTSAHTRAPSGTRIVSNPLNGIESLEAARVVLANMRDDLNERMGVPVSRAVLLVPDNKLAAAQQLLNSLMTPGVDNEHNPWGPNGEFRPMLVSTSKLDDLSTTAWYLGYFKEQFVRVHRLRAEFAEMLGTNTHEWLRRRIIWEGRIALEFEIGARDHNRVVQNLSGTAAATSPSVS